jgi:hypothetical protein
MVHCLRHLCDLTKSVDRQMLAMIHHLEDLLELQEVLTLCRNQWIRIEERDDHFTKFPPSVNVEDKEVLLVIVMPAVSIDASATKEILEQLERRKTPLSLHHRKPRLHLPPTTHALVSLNRATEAAFTVDEADDPLRDLWPFLLIVRTGRIFTAHVSHSKEEVRHNYWAGSAGYSEFPANSQLHLRHR